MAHAFNSPFQRGLGDSKCLSGERRSNDSYTEEEPKCFSPGPTSQSETAELTGCDDTILEENHKGRKHMAWLKEGSGKSDKSFAPLGRQVKSNSPLLLQSVMAYRTVTC